MTTENVERITAARCLSRYRSLEQCRHRRRENRNVENFGINSSGNFHRRHHFTSYNITTSLLIILVVIVTQPRITTSFRQPYIIGGNNNIETFRIIDSIQQSSLITNGGSLGRRYSQHRHCNILLRQSKKKDDENDNNSTPTTAASAAATTIHETTTTATTTKKPIETYTGRELYDNGLSIVTDDDGSVTVVVDDTDEEETTEMEHDDEEEEPTTVSSHDDDNDNDGTKALSNVTNSKVAPSDDDEITVDAKPTPSTSSSTATTTSETPTKTTPSPKDDDATTTPLSPTKKVHNPPPLREHTPPKKLIKGFNVVLTHCNADFDSLASAVGLAKLWSTPHKDSNSSNSFDSSHPLPTFVVLPRGAHPGVQRFLSLHKHLFPIRSLSSLPSSQISRLGLVDAQKRDRIGPAEHLLGLAERVTVVDHHVEADSDIGECTDYVVDKVGSVSSLIVERLIKAEVEVTEAEATLLALGIHADTGSLCYDSTTARDAKALAWVMEQGASQSAIAEHVHGKLSTEQKGVLTQALLNVNTTVVHGVTISTVLLSTDGFINGLAAVTQDALELSGSDVLILSVIYDAKTSSKRKKKSKSSSSTPNRARAVSSFFSHPKRSTGNSIMNADAWKGGEEALTRRRLRAAFQRRDIDGSGFLELEEVRDALNGGGVFATDETVDNIMSQIDLNHDGKISFDEFQSFVTLVQKEQQLQLSSSSHSSSSTMILIGRVKTGINLKQINLNKLFAPYGGGGHAKAASATVRLGNHPDESTEARDIMETLIQELIATSLVAPPIVGDFMTAPVLSARPDMTEKQVEDLFTRYDVRALPVVDEENDVIGLVTYKEVAAAKERLWNKEQKRLREEGKNKEGEGGGRRERRKLGSALKGWMKQHVRIVEASKTMAEVEALLLECDVGCIPVVADGTNQLVGMVTRTDILRQHRYYPTLYYHNKGFSDSIAARKPIIELRKKLKKYDMLEEDSV